MHRVFRIPYVTRVCAALEFLGVLHSLHHVLHNREYNCDMLNEWIDLSSGKKKREFGNPASHTFKTSVSPGPMHEAIVGK